MRLLTAAICLALSASAGACVGPTEPAGTVTIDDGFARAGGTWSSGGALLMAAGFRESGGRVAVCGAWTTTPQSVLSKQYNADVVAAGAVAVGGRHLVNGLGFMTRLQEDAQLEGATARCVATDRPWEPSLSTALPAVYLPRMEFEYDELMGPLAVFTQVR